MEFAVLFQFTALFRVAKVENRMTSLQITKSVSTQEGKKAMLVKRGPDTMGMKHRVDHGVYVFYGSMNPQLASKTGFSDKDAAAIKEALRTLFINDESSARPAGSMTVHKVYWWEHNSPNGQYSSAKVHRLLNVKVKDGITEPRSIDDYQIKMAELPGLKCEIIEGEMILEFCLWRSLAKQDWLLAGEPSSSSARPYRTCSRTTAPRRVASRAFSGSSFPNTLPSWATRASRTYLTA